MRSGAELRHDLRVDAIRAEQLTKFYGRSRGVAELDLTVAFGEVFGFLGPNGAGNVRQRRVFVMVAAMLRLHHRDKAGRPLRVRWALEEAGADYDFAVMTQEEGKGEEHKQRHPLGRVPVLETDDGFLFESAALCLQVADLHPGANLIPPLGTYERGLVYQWTIFAMSELEPAIIRAYTAMQAGDADRTASTRERLTNIFAALEQALDGHDFIAGDDFTIADVVVGGVLVAAQRRELMPDSPNLKAYVDRLNARPAKQRAYESSG